MTGTAATEAAEFSQIYKLEVTEVPTNRPPTAPTTPTLSSAPRQVRAVLPIYELHFACSHVSLHLLCATAAWASSSLLLPCQGI